MANFILYFSFYNNYNINYKIMKNITNIIEVDCDNFNFDVKYQFQKGHSGNWLNPPDEDTIDIKRVYLNNYITEEGDVVNINKRIIPAVGNGITRPLPSVWEKEIIKNIRYDLDNFN